MHGIRLLVRRLLPFVVSTGLLSPALAADVHHVYVAGEGAGQVFGRQPTSADQDLVNAGKRPQFYCGTVDLVASGPDVAPGATKDLQPCGTARRISDRADRVMVSRLVVVPPGSCGKVASAVRSRAAQIGATGKVIKLSVDERKRHSYFGEGLRKIVDFLIDKAKDGVSVAAAPTPMQWCLIHQAHQVPQERQEAYTLQYERSLLTLTAEYVGTADGNPSDGDKDAKATAQLITGPDEHWFLSGDAIVSGPKEVKWDSATNTLVARDKPNQLYLGFNYMWGDVFSKHNAGAKERIVGKLMIQPSKRPFDSFGLGVGYRFADGVLTVGESQESGGFMLFAGVFWTRSDALNNSGAVVAGGRERSVRVGVSYGLDNLINWVKTP